MSPKKGPRSNQKTTQKQRSVHKVKPHKNKPHSIEVSLSLQNTEKDGLYFPILKGRRPPQFTKHLDNDSKVDLANSVARQQLVKAVKEEPPAMQEDNSVIIKTPKARGRPKKVTFCDVLENSVVSGTNTAEVTSTPGKTLATENKPTSKKKKPISLKKPAARRILTRKRLADSKAQENAKRLKVEPDPVPLNIDIKIENNTDSNNIPDVPEPQEPTVPQAEPELVTLQAKVIKKKTTLKQPATKKPATTISLPSAEKTLPTPKRKRGRPGKQQNAQASIETSSIVDLLKNKVTEALVETTQNQQDAPGLIESRKSSISTSSSTSKSWTKDVSSSSNTTYIGSFGSNDFVRINKKLPVLKLTNIDSEVKKRQNEAHLYECKSSDSERTSEQLIDSLGAHSLNLSASSSRMSTLSRRIEESSDFTEESTTDCTEEKYSKCNKIRFTNKTATKQLLSLTLEKLDQEIIQWMRSEDEYVNADMVKFKDKMFNIMDREFGVITHIQHIKETLKPAISLDSLCEDCDDITDIEYASVIENSVEENATVKEGTTVKKKSVKENPIVKKSTTVKKNPVKENATVKESTTVKMKSVEENAIGKKSSAVKNNSVKENATVKESTTVKKNSIEENATIKESTTVKKKSVEENTMIKKSTAVKKKSVKENATVTESATVKKNSVDENATVKKSTTVKENTKEVIGDFVVPRRRPSRHLSRTSEGNVSNASTKVETEDEMTEGISNHNPYYDRHDDDDTLSLFAESISGFESSKMNTSTGPVFACKLQSVASKLQPAEEYIPQHVREDYVPNTERIIYCPTKIREDAETMASNVTVCEKQNADSTSIYKQSVSTEDSGSYQDIHENIDLDTKPDPPDVVKKIHLMDSYLEIMPKARSVVLGYVCFYNLMYCCRNGRNGTCRFRHLIPTREQINDKLNLLDERTLIQEYLLLRKWPVLRRKYGMCYVDQCAKRRLTRILVEMAYDNIVKARSESEEDTRLRVYTIEVTLLHLNMVDLGICEDLLKLTIDPVNRTLLCDVFMATMSITQNFSRFKTVFLNLTYFMVENGRKFSKSVVEHFLERVCILHFEEPTARTLIQMMRLTDSDIFQNSMIGHFEQQISVSKDVLEEYMLLKNTVSTLNALSSFVTDAPPLKVDTSAQPEHEPQSPADSPDTTLDNIMNNAAEEPPKPVITRTIGMNPLIIFNRSAMAPGVSQAYVKPGSSAFINHGTSQAYVNPGTSQAYDNPGTSLAYASHGASQPYVSPGASQPYVSPGASQPYVNKTESDTNKDSVKRNIKQWRNRSIYPHPQPLPTAPFMRGTPKRGTPIRGLMRPLLRPQMRPPQRITHNQRLVRFQSPSNYPKRHPGPQY